MAKKKPEAAKKSETPAPEKKPTKIKANGVTRPKAGTICGRIWEMADSLSATINAPADRASILEQAKIEGINGATASTQYGKWCKFHGVSIPRAAKAGEEDTTEEDTTEEDTTEE